MYNKQALRVKWALVLVQSFLPNIHSPILRESYILFSLWCVFHNFLLEECIYPFLFNIILKHMTCLESGSDPYPSRGSENHWIIAHIFFLWHINCNYHKGVFLSLLYNKIERHICILIYILKIILDYLVCPSIISWVLKINNLSQLWSDRDRSENTTLDIMWKLNL